MAAPDLPVQDLIPVLQVAIGPVILISGVGLLLLSMTNRFGRVIDRARSLARSLDDATPEEEERVRRKIRERGLTFEVFLPETMADWVKEKVAAGLFEDPAEAAFVAFQTFIDLHEHPEIQEQLLKAVIEDSINDPRPGIPAEQVFADLEARIRKLAEPE